MPGNITRSWVGGKAVCDQLDLRTKPTRRGGNSSVWPPRQSLELQKLKTIFKKWWIKRWEENIHIQIVGFLLSDYWQSWLDKFNIFILQYAKRKGKYISCVSSFVFVWLHNRINCHFVLYLGRGNVLIWKNIARNTRKQKWARVFGTWTERSVTFGSEVLANHWNNLLRQRTKGLHSGYQDYVLSVTHCLLFKVTSLMYTK